MRSPFQVSPKSIVAKATSTDLEIARSHLKHEAFEMLCLDRWLELIAQALRALPPGTVVRQAFDLAQLRTMKNAARPRE